MTPEITKAVKRLQRCLRSLADATERVKAAQWSDEALRRERLSTRDAALEKARAHLDALLMR